MINILIEKLYKLFPLYPIPDPEGIIFLNDFEASEDCAVLRGRSWEQIGYEELRLHWSVFSWLNADYFHYYIPSVMLHSLKEIKSSKRISDMELPVESVFFYIALGDVFDEKWRIFSLEQLQFVKKWHSLILSQEKNSEIEWHMKNMEDLIFRLYPNSMPPKK